MNAIWYIGATPFFVDCLEETGNINPGLLEQALDQLRAEGASVPVVIPVNMLGKCADYTSIMLSAERYGAKVLADSAESFGASHAGRSAGAWGDAAVLSFNGNKIMTTSEGGMLFTDDGVLAAHVRELSTQTREAVAHYEHTELGYNCRFSNILAAPGRTQLIRLDAMIGRRRQRRKCYRALFADQSGVSVLGGNGDGDDNCWLTAIVVDPEKSSWTTRDLSEALAAEGVESRPV